MPAVAYRPRYSIEDYLGWEGDWELWDGIAVAMSPSPKYDHGRAVLELAYQIRRQFDQEASCHQCSVVAEIDWQVNQHTVVRPDLSVVCGETPEDWIKQAPALVAEFLSPATRDKGLNAKRALYAAQGVPYYLIGDLETKTLTILVRQKDGSYAESDETRLELHSGCVVEVEPAKVFS